MAVRPCGDRARAVRREFGGRYRMGRDLGSAVAAGAADTVTEAPASAEAAGQARKAAASFSILTSLSLLIGAFIGRVTGALGGYHRDES